MANDTSLTPMMEQYFRIKELHPGALLFFRLGDFYEMFYDDARTAAPVLDIALTSRQKVPMCGVPYHAVNAYVPKLLKQGFKVAICEQVEDPKAAKGVVRREVIKVLTPGTAVEVEAEEAKESTFIASLALEDGGWGLALLDLAAGEVRTLEGGWPEAKLLADEIFKAGPREIVYPEGAEDALRRVLPAEASNGAALSPAEGWLFDPPQAARAVLEHFGARSLAGFGLEDKPRAAAAAGALLAYVKRVRKDSLELVRRLSYLNAAGYLVLDAATVRNLELVRNLRDGKVKGTLLDVIDFTVTSPGGRLLRAWLLRPLCDAAAIAGRQDAVAEALAATIARREIRETLKSVHDLERLVGKIGLSAAQPRDLVALKASLVPLPSIERELRGFACGLFRDMAGRWDNAADVAGLVDRAILDEPAFLLTEGGLIKDGWNAELDELRAVSRSGKGFIAELESRERARTGIGSLKVRYNKIFGYFIEVTKPNLPQVPADYMRKQTLVNSERFLTPELKEYEDKVLHAEERIGQLEHRLFLEVRETLARETARLQRIAADVAALDVLLALAECAARRGYVRPVVDEGDVLRIEAGRHPVIETSQAEPFIPNDLELDAAENQVLIITGPNMGGKSTFLRQAALIVLLTQMGAFVPAKSARVGLADRIFTRIGAMDFLSVGQSTFMVEMLETAAILHNATSRSLILLDEVGRGTSTFDGLSIAWAVAERLHERPDIRPRTLFATHYHELTELALTLPRIKNFHVSVKEWRDEVVFLRKIVAGPSDRSYGIHVAKLAGLPRDVIERAREILFNLEKQELDEAGLPRLARRARPSGDRNQLLLFAEDRESALLRELRDEIEGLDPASLTPIEALNILAGLKGRLGSPEG
ncbi:MAG TPA: DNA mismatch repair protein MutS [Candidatus Aminicenantes bacterium]|nr:DNA mismatch repair protein MutS [Candidatus Aminicenantes bacterium]HRY65020.1 DNA mismatch repair protein MutS [Candidatus Aminicenantes bacterium]HRZ71933.1 DNA mismatch repair protein MutS [Candidatus Aminicenantes bacterium]